MGLKFETQILAKLICRTHPTYLTAAVARWFPANPPSCYSYHTSLIIREAKCILELLIMTKFVREVITESCGTTDLFS